MDMDFKFDEQTIQMSILGLTGMKTRLQSSGHKREERERERDVVVVVVVVYWFVTRSTFGNFHWP